MKKESFSFTVKEHLKNSSIKKKCCRRAFDDGSKIFSDGVGPEISIRKGIDGLVCPECRPHFIAGFFVACGNVSDPNKSYHMEFSLTDENVADVAYDLLCDVGYPPKKTKRKNRWILYYKNSVTIEDLMGYIGASFGAFELINAKIVKEIRDNTNKQVNCDSANISKSICAADKQIKMINELKTLGRFNALMGDLKETAELRVQYPNISIAELGQKFTPPISKSGVKHRLDKIADFYFSEITKDNKSH